MASFDPNGPQSPLSTPTPSTGTDPLAAAGPLSSSTPIPDAIQAQNQQQALQEFNQYQQQLSDQASQQQQQQKPKHHGWSLNPFQDIGQVWHDVDVNAINPTSRQLRRVYTDVVSHPVSTLLTLGNEADFKKAGLGFFFNGDNWVKAWQASNHISPGQAVITGFHNGGFLGLGRNSTTVDPEDPEAVQKLFTKNAWGNRIMSGTLDFGLNMFDPSAAALKVAGAGATALRARPITAASDIDQIMGSGRTQRMIDWVTKQNVAKGDAAAATIAEHSMLKSSPVRYQMATLLAGAADRNEVTNILRVAFGDSNAYQKLAQVNEAMAYRAANLLAPAETMEKFALDSNPWRDTFQWLEDPEKAKVAAAQAKINTDMETVKQLMDASGLVRKRTTSTALAERLAGVRATTKYANTRDTDHVSFLGRNLYDTPVRIYQSFTDRPMTGLIDHRQDFAAEHVRAWLNKSGVLDTETKQDLAAKYARAGIGDRPQVWDSIKQQAYRALDDHFGLPAGTGSNILKETTTRQAALTQAVAAKRFGAVRGLSETSEEAAGALPTATSEVLAHPALVSALQQGAELAPNLRYLETVFRRMQQNGLLRTVGMAGDRGQDLMVNLLDKAYGVWKPLVLLSMHRAYNHIGDDYLRVMSKLGALRTVENAAVGTSNFVRNRVGSFGINRVIKNAESQHELMINDAKAKYEGLVAQQRAARFTQFARPPVQMVSQAEIDAAKRDYDTLRLRPAPGIQAKHRIGTGYSTVKGTNISAPDMFSGPNGPLMQQMGSSSAFWDSMVDDAAHRMHAAGAAEARQYPLIHPLDDEAKHLRAYRTYVNEQLMVSPPGRMTAQGASVQEVADWLEHSAAGRAFMRQANFGDPEAMAQTFNELVAKYLPTREMRDAAIAGKFSSRLIQRALPNPSTRPEIPSAALANVHGVHPAAGRMRRFTDWAMKWTGTMPDNIMVRHPAANAFYKAHRDDLIKQWMAQNGGQITADQVDRLSFQATKLAREDLRQTVYDVSRFNDAGHYLRFMSPFFNAWFNAMSSWSKLFIQNPQLLARSFQAKRMLWNNPLAINSDTGLPADDNTPMDKLTFVMHLPQPLAKALGGLGTIPIDAKTLISPTYADSVGNPGFGPIVTVPANSIAKSSPTAADSQVMKYITGGMVSKSSFSQLIPSGVRDAVGLSQLLGIGGSPSDNANYAKLVWSIYQEQMYDWQSGLRQDPPNWADVKNTASHMTALDYIVNRLSPLGFKPSPTHEFYATEYKAILNQNNGDVQKAQQAFYDKHGAAPMVFAQSLSDNSSGVPSTSNGAQAYLRYKSLIQKFPELASVIIGPEGNGNFDDAAYQWEVANGLRTIRTPEDAAKQANINLGWAQYGKLLAAINVQLQQRGLTSVNQKGAKDLKAQKQRFVQELSDPNSKLYNKDWYDNYGSFNQNQYQTRIQDLLSIAQDKTLLTNPVRSDIRSLQAYSQLRDITYQVLQDPARKSHSITAKSNWDVAQWYDQQVSNLIMSDTKFAQLFVRYLEKDNFSTPT